MKNKKLFAILTLVCFMFTLMPVAAFAAADLKIKQEANGDVVVTAADTTKTVLYSKDASDQSFSQSGATLTDGVLKIAAANVANWSEAKSYSVNADGSNAVTVDAQMIAYAKAKTNPAVDTGESTIATVKSNVEMDVADYTNVVIDFNEAFTTNAGTQELIVWAEKTNDVASKALVVVAGSNVDSVDEINTSGVYKVVVTGQKHVEMAVAFTTPGEYDLHAAIIKDTTAAIDIDSIDSELKTEVNYKTIVVEGTNLDSSKFEMTVTGDIEGTVGSGIKIYDGAVEADKTAVTVEEAAVKVMANGVNEKEVTLTFVDENKEVVVGATINLDTNSSAVELSKDVLTTNYKGQVTFKVSGTIEGEYVIDVVCEDFDAEINVVVGSTAATYIELDEQPKAPQALYGAMKNDVITFEITDINGNIITSLLDDGMDGINGELAGEYIVLTEAPKASKLESKDLGLKYLGDGTWGLTGVEKDAEGTYAVKVILDNGAYATAEWSVKKFQTPVKLMIVKTPDTIELGAKVMPVLTYLDANGVSKSADDAELAATGYAIADLSDKNVVTLKTDEKYAGSVITLTAVSEKYDLVATKEIKVAAEAVAIDFEDADLEVNVNNKVEWFVVDADGNKVSLASEYATGVNATVKYVVLDAPEGAKVSVTGDQAINNFQGEGEMKITSNKVGNVTVQAIAKVEFGTSDKDSTIAKQTKYYTGTVVLPIGMEGSGDVVVLSIGSHQIVKNDEVKDIPAAAVIKDNRTFVPFRAVGEAFGANVVWDEPTQSVIAELNGVKVVLTIGSTSYTVNGVEKQADVAPYIDGASTMVPVRFIATAFGIEPIVTQNPDGTTADILFLL